jgi:methyl-coenzyme M reductase subunit D
MDIEIFPHRLLSADTTERLLNSLDEIDGVKKIVLQGQRLPSDAANPDYKKSPSKEKRLIYKLKLAEY